jgi:hypothetical protein
MIIEDQGVMFFQRLYRSALLLGIEGKPTKHHRHNCRHYQQCPQAETM